MEDFSQKKLFKSDNEYKRSHQDFKDASSLNLDSGNFSSKDTAVVVLAGGKGRRFNNQDKASLEIGGESFINRIYNQLGSFEKKYLSLASHREHSGFDGIITDQFSDKGPVGAIISVLEEVREEYILFIPCDMPLIKEEVLQTFITALKTANCEAIIACDENNKIHPLLCAVNKKALVKIREEFSQDNLRVLAVFKKLDTYTLQVDSKFLVNINTKEDLQLAERYL